MPSNNRHPEPIGYRLSAIGYNMSNDDLDDLITRLKRLSPEERANLAAHLTGQSAEPPAGVPAGPSVAGDAEVVQQVNVSADGRINGVIVGTNLGTIIFGRDPSEDERRRLVWYLHTLANDLRRLPLRGLDPALADGRGIDLSQVYVMLATSTPIIMAQGQVKDLEQFCVLADTWAAPDCQGRIYTL